MRTLLLTDLHFIDKPRGLLEAQTEAILKIIEAEYPHDIIIMGDLMMHRKPVPKVLLALKRIVDYAEERGIYLTIIRGNHDSDTKADDGITALSLFDYHADVIVDYELDFRTKRAYIPHYENENYIKECLESVPTEYTVFGHFGYAGCLNSVGDADFGISRNLFRNTTYLGHIHGFNQRGKITILGTPYTTNFGEAKKENFYAILQDGCVEFKSPTSGPRHLVVDHKDLDNNLDYINDPTWFTLLRVMIDSDCDSVNYDNLDVGFLDIKWKPSFEGDEESSYVPQRDLFTINEVIIEDYVDSSKTSINKDDLMEGYSLIKNED